MELKQLIKLASRHILHTVPESIYLNTGKDFTKPISIRGIVNERCNYKCRYCDFWRLEHYRDEISIEQWQEALLSLKKFIGPYSIQFSGGEPFLKKGFVDLLDFCHTHGIDWGVITNGSFLDSQTVKKIAQARPLYVEISADSDNPEINDYVRGRLGALEKIEKGIALLRQERERLSLKFPIRIKPTVHKYNFKHLPELVQWTKEVGATTIDFAPVRFFSDQVKTELWIKEQADLETLETVISTLISMKQSGAPIETSDAKIYSLADHFRENLVFHGVSPCRVGLRDYHINPNGEVFMCWFYPTIGNVKESSARDLWYGEKAAQIRAQNIACQKFGSTDCANSCLSHRTLSQKIELGSILFRMARAGGR